MMDAQGIAIGLGVFVLSAVIIYAISALTMREKTFEQVMEEQRGRQITPVGHAKSSKDKQQKKKKKSKAKVKAEDVVANDLGDTEEVEEIGHVEEEEHKMVQLEIEPEIIEPKATPVVENVPRRRKEKKSKSILVNKDERVLVKPDLKADVEHHSFVPLDDIELKHERERRDSHNSSASTEPKVSRREEPIIQKEEVILAQVAAPMTQAQAPSKKQKKQKSTNAAMGDAGQGNLNSVLKAISTASLSEADTQTLLDTLLSKQGQEWTKKSQKGDPMAALKKQVEEKDKIISDLQESVNNVTAQVRSMKQEVMVEKQRAMSADQQVNRGREEVQAMHARMQQSHEQHQAEVASLRMQCEQMKVHQTQLPALIEENRQLKEANARASQVDVDNLNQNLKMLQEELSKSVLRCNQAEDARQISERKTAKYEEQLRELSQQAESSQILTQKLNEVNEELRRLQVQAEGKSRDIEKVSSEKSRVEQELANMRNMLKSMESSRQDTETGAKAMQAKLDEMAREKATIQSQYDALDRQKQEQGQEIKALQEEKANLHNEVATLKSKAEMQQNEAAPPVDDDTKLQLTQAQSALSQKETEVKTLNSNMQSLTADIAKLKEDMDSQKQKNDTLEAQLVSVKQEAKQSTESVQSDFAKIQQQLQDKTKELDDFKAQTEAKKNQENQEMAQSSALWQQLQDLQKDIREREAANDKLQQEIDALKKSNEELSKAKSEAKGVSSEKESLEKTVVSLKEELQSKESELQGLADSVDTLKKQNSNLEKQKDDAIESHFGEVELLNSEIQKLEAKLQEKASQPQELDILRQQNNDLTKKIEALENSTQQPISNGTLTDQEISSLKEQLQSQQSTIADLQSQLQSKDSQLNDMDSKLQTSQSDVHEAAVKLSDLKVQLQRMGSHDAKMHGLQEDLDAKQADLNELKKKNELLEKSVQEKVDSAQEETSKSYKELLRRLHPDVDVTSSSSISEVAQIYETQVLQRSSSDTSSQDDSKLQAEVLHYKNVLANTEDILKRLQSSVESEETRWKYKLQSSEDELKKTKEELGKAKKMHAETQGSKEMEDKVKELELKLESAESEKVTLHQELAAIKGKLEDIEKAPPASPSGNGKHELVKLKAQVKFGEDALRQEQELVRSLQEQLSKQKQSMANGTSPVVDEAKEAVSAANEGTSV